MSARRLSLLLIMCAALGQSVPIRAQDERTQETAVDYTALAQPNYANQLALTAEQRAALANILDERTKALVEAAPADRQQVLAESNRKLMQLLTDEQKKTFASIAARGKLQFDFSQTEWPEVLDWFARQAELALVMDQTPTGTLTYRDAKQYTPTEAIDLLNSVLLSKGFTLMRRERMLIVVNTSEGIPFEMAPKVTVEDLASRGRFEIVTVEFPLEGRPVSTCVAAVQELVGEHGRVTPLTAAGKLLVTETAGKLQAINIVISSIPIPKPAPGPGPKPPEPVFAVYPATGLDPTTTVQTLKGLFEDASVTADPKAEEVHVYATPALQAAVKASLEKMIANVSGDNRPRLETYAVDADDLSQLQTQLELAVPNVQVSIDETNRRVLVVGNAEQQSAVRQTLQKLGWVGAESDDQDRAVVVIYQVEDESTAALAELLEQVLSRAAIVSQPGRIAVRGRKSEQSLAQSTIDQFKRTTDDENRPLLRFHPLRQRLDAELLSTLQATIPDVTITQMDDGQRLAAVATPREHEQIATTLEQIAADLPATAKRSLKFYPVTEPQRKRLTLVREDLLAELPNIKLMLDASPREIALWASEAQHARFSEVLKELLGEHDDRHLTVHRFPIKTASPDQLLSVLRGRFPHLQLQLTPARDALLVWEDAERIEAIKDELAKLTAVLPQKEELTLETYSVPAAEASAILTAAQQLVPNAQSRLDSSNRRLIVVSSASDHALVGELVEKLAPKEDLATDVLISYELKHADPEAVVQMLAELRPDLSFAADRRANRVLVTAPLREQPRMQAVIQQLDASPNANAQVELKPYRLRNVNPAVLVELLQPLVPEMQLTVDEDSKQLLASGVAIDHQRLENVIRRIDGQDKPTGEVKNYSVGSADSNQVRDVILQLVPSSVVSANPESARLLVWADNEQQAIIKQAIDQFTGQAAQRTRELRTYPLPDQIGPSALAFIQSIVPDAASSLDASERILICWATAEQHDLVRKAVDGLNDDRGADRTVKVYALDGVDAKLIKQLIEAEAPEAVVLDSPDSHRVFVQASTEDHETIAAIIKNLAQASGDFQQRVLRTHEVRQDIAAQVRQYLTQSVVSLELVNGSANGRITGWATVAGHARIEQLIKEFEQELERPEPRVLEVYQLRAASPSDVRTVLNETLKNLRFLSSADESRLLCLATAAQHPQIRDTIQRLDDASIATRTYLRVYPIKRGRITAQAVADSLDAKLTESTSYQVNTETNSLIVRGAEDDHARMKAAIDELVSQLPAAPRVESQVYQLRNSKPSDAVRVLEGLLPDARWAVNDDRGTLAATGSMTDHDRIKDIVDQMESIGPDAAAVTEIYRFRKASAETARATFQMLAPKAVVAFDADANVVIATATDADHQVFRDAAVLLDGRSETTTVQVYPLDKLQIAASDVMESLDEDLKETAAIQVNETLNSLIVRAGEADQRQIRLAIDAIVAQLPSTPKRTLQVYPLKLAAPETVQQAVAPMIPDALVLGDAKSGALLVNATSAEHQAVADVIDKLDTVSSQQPLMRAYPIRRGDADRVFESISQAFQNNGEFNITYQATSGTMFVVATPTNHAIFEDVVGKLDQPAALTEKRHAKVYAISNLDGNAATSALNTLFEGRRPAVQVEFDERGNSLLVVADVSQHQEVADALRQLEGGERELEVFELRDNDPLVVENAVRDLFSQVPPGASPSVTSDYDSQKLFVRGTETQIEQIRQLLARMGEAVLAADNRQSGVVRTIPFGGDTLEAARQIERIWPRLRANRIQVITPSEANPRRRIETREPDDGDDKQPADGPAEDQGASLHPAKMRTRFVAQQNNEQAQPTDDDKPTIVILPEQGRITIASPDLEALDQIESLLRAMSRGDARDGGNTYFAVYMLRNTGAPEIQRLLEDLIERLPMTRSGIGDIVVVADERLNALVVYGNRKDRQMLEELLRVLDTHELPNPMVVHRPQIIPLKNTQAVRVIEILRSVYATQLTSGGGRKQVSIPEGVSTEVASVLEQINAAAAGPLLTLDLDAATNSIVMRAPPELSTEINDFVDKLDRHAQAGPHRGIRVIQLKNGKSDQIKEVLDRFMLE